jgi:biopolymer transport protein TolR
MDSAPRKRRLIGEINVVPLIDVMLVLLVIFMATAPLLTQGIQVELPKATTEPLSVSNQKNQPPIVVSIDREARLYLNLGPQAAQPLDDAALGSAVAAALAQAPDRDVLIKGDAEVAYGRVVTAMVVLQQAGARKLGFLADPLPDRVGTRP